MKLFKVFSMGVVMLMAVGCGGTPPKPGTEVAEADSRAINFPPPSTWFIPYLTDPGHNKAEATDVYACSGWSYRMMFSWAQYLDPSSPTGVYAAVGPSSVALTGANHHDVSADVYLQCFGGILPQDRGTQPGGNPIYDMFYASTWDVGQWVPCNIRTVWPAEWHAPDVVTPVVLRAYYYTPAPRGADADPMNPNGIVHLYLSSAWAGGDPGRGWCGDGWVQAMVTTQDKITEVTDVHDNVCQDAINLGLIQTGGCGCWNGNLNPPACDYYPPPCSTTPIEGCMDFPPKSGGS